MLASHATNQRCLLALACVAASINASFLGVQPSECQKRIETVSRSAFGSVTSAETGKIKCAMIVFRCFRVSPWRTRVFKKSTSVAAKDSARMVTVFTCFLSASAFSRMSFVASLKIVSAVPRRIFQFTRLGEGPHGLTGRVALFFGRRFFGTHLLRAPVGDDRRSSAGGQLVERRSSFLPSRPAIGSSAATGLGCHCELQRFGVLTYHKISSLVFGPSLAGPYQPSHHVGSFAGQRSIMVIIDKIARGIDRLEPVHDNIVRTESVS